MLGFSRGDTIIEVLLAITVFSLVATGAITIMNQGNNAAQRALEITLVRQQVDAQAEAIRASQQAFATKQTTESTWPNITGASTAHYYDSHPAASCPHNDTDVPGSFIMDAQTATPLTVSSDWFVDINDASAPPYAQVRYDTSPAKAYGIWVERDFTSGSAANNLPDLYTFTINACWNGVGLNGTPIKVSTVVRLYAPST